MALVYKTQDCARCGERPRAPSHAYCRECRNAYSAEYRRRRYRDEAAYRQTIKDAQRLYRYGLTEEQYGEMLARQGGVCAICDSAPGKRPLAVDHCHESGEVRALLCDGCNAGLGMFKDNPELMAKAIEYLAIFDN